MSSESLNVVSGVNSTPFGSRRAHSIIELRLQDFVVIALRRHRHQLPADQLDALILVHEARRDYGLDICHSEPAARQTFRSLRRLAFVGPVRFK